MYIYIFYFFIYIYITFIYNFWWFRSTSGWQSKDCFREQIANAKIEINKSAFWTNLPLNVVMWEYKLSKWSGVSLSVVVHRGFVFMEHLVISTHCHTEDNGCYILKAVNPFFPLWSLSPHIKQPGDETSHTFRTHAKPCTCMCAHTQETQCMLRNKIGQPKISDLHQSNMLIKWNNRNDFPIPYVNYLKIDFEDNYADLFRFLLFKIWVPFH